MLALTRRLAILTLLSAGLIGVAACGGGHPGQAGAGPAARPPPGSPVGTTPVGTTPNGTRPTSTASPVTIPPGGTTPGSTTPGSTTPSSTTPPIPTTPTGHSVAPMTPSGPAAALYRTALADARSERWVHGVSTTAPGTAGGAPTTFVSDDGPRNGTQDITVGPVAGHIRVVGTRTYIRGGPQALVDLFGMPEGVAGRLGGRWVQLGPGDSEYTSVTAGVTISSFLSETGFSGPVTEAAGRLGGAPVTVITGALAAGGTGTGTLYVSDTSRPLPLRWRIVQGNATTATSFTAWGHAVAVAAPPGAVALPDVPGATITVGFRRPA